jgi:hypothetical protein
MIRGIGADRNPTGVRRRLILKKPVVCVIRVRNDRVAVALDGDDLIQWKTDYSDLSLESPKWKDWVRRDRSLLAIGTLGTELVLPRAEVVEVSGPGTFTRPEDPAARKAKAECERVTRTGPG